MLLNGRRLANYAFNGATVDLNSIPLAAIDRVEVLKDGASAIYGTDAIAGVINFVLRKDYSGVDVSASFDVSQHGGGNSGQASLTLGTGDPARDGYNLFGVFSYQKQQALHGDDRESTRTSYRPDLDVSGLSALTFPSNIIDRPRRRLLNPSAATGCAPPSSLPANPAAILHAGLWFRLRAARRRAAGSRAHQRAGARHLELATDRRSLRRGADRAQPLRDRHCAVPAAGGRNTLRQPNLSGVRALLPD